MIKKMVLLTVLLLVIVLSLGIVLQLYPFINSDLRQFAGDCRGLKAGISRSEMLHRMERYQLLDAPDGRTENTRTPISLVYRVSEKYSADLCFVTLSNDEVVDSRFSPD